GVLVFLFLDRSRALRVLHSFPTRRSSDLVAIGNAPTALFRLLERIDAGAPKPAAILGIPVGFVGAAESKDALAENPRGVPFLIVDRKSTRLNSSHRTISYAVFCLKKKTEN